MDPSRSAFDVGKIKSSIKSDILFDGDIGGSSLVRRPVAEPDEKDLETNPLVADEYDHSYKVKTGDNREEVESIVSDTDTASDFSGENTIFVGVFDWARKKMVRWTRTSRSAQSASCPVMTRRYLQKYINRDSSPWVLSIKVQAHAKHDKRKRKWKYIEATFDTGMEQGNMASFDVVVKVLNIPKNNFLDLTPMEKLGGICVDGNKIIPIGAIELTWKGAEKGARIFRKMRFLVTEEGLSPPFQLVIGTQSLAKEKIIGPPALIAASPKKIVVMPKGTIEELKLADAKALQNETEAVESEAVYQMLVKQKKEKQAAMRNLKQKRGTRDSSQSTLDSASDSGTTDSASDSGL